MENFTLFKELYQNLDISFKIDMVKTASKNYLKLTKKFILEKIFKDPKTNVNFSLEKVLDYLSKTNNN
jgi:hypothetical protein